MHRKTLERCGAGVASLLLAAVAISGCSSSSGENPGNLMTTHKGDYPYKVVATCGMVTDIVRQVAGDFGEVEGLMGADVDPHLFRPKKAHMTKLDGANVIFYSGLMLEGRMGDAFLSFANTGKPVFPVTRGIDESFLREPPEFEGHWDPHVWMDVAAWSECVGYVAEALSEYDSEHAKDYRSKANEYREELKALDEYVRTSIASIPKEQRVLITAHDAFGYFARAYDIEVKAPQGISTESQAGLADITNLVDFIVERKIRAIFVESSVNPKNIESIIAAARDRGWEVEIGGELFSDAMGEPDTYEGTYVGMMDHNATIITRALGGNAPAAGYLGKLATESE